jgi:hypothetical protein
MTDLSLEAGYSKSTDHDDYKRRIEADARNALRRLKTDQTVEDWRAVGDQQNIITEEVMSELGLTEWAPNDRKLVREVTRRFEDWERSVSNDHPLTKQERWALRELTNDSKYLQWYATLTKPERRRLNHPNAIINRWKKAHPDSNKLKLHTPRKNAINFEIVIDTVVKQSEAMDTDNRCAVLERLIHQFKNELLSIIEKFREPPTETKAKKIKDQVPGRPLLAPILVGSQLRRA